MTIYCPKYHAQIKEETCLARRVNSVYWESYDPECRKCDYARNRVDKLREERQIAADLVELGGMMVRLGKKILEKYGEAL